MFGWCHILEKKKKSIHERQDIKKGSHGNVKCLLCSPPGWLAGCDDRQLRDLASGGTAVQQGHCRAAACFTYLDALERLLVGESFHRVPVDFLDLASHRHASDLDFYKVRQGRK